MDLAFVIITNILCLVAGALLVILKQYWSGRIAGEMALRFGVDPWNMYTNYKYTTIPHEKGMRDAAKMIIDTEDIEETTHGEA